MSQRIEFDQTGGPEVLKLVDGPEPVPTGHEVLVSNRAIGVNFIDIYHRTGLYPLSTLPSGLGTEGAGVVEAVGESVTRFKPGDRVAYANAPLGAYASSHLISEQVLVHLPESISFEVAAAAMLKGLTVQYLLERLYPLKAGQTILFHAAAGGVGSIACQWARALGVRLIGTVGSDEKAEKARSHGAWATINYERESVVDRVMTLTEGEKCPVVYDSVGRSTWETSLDCLQRRGMMVSFGNASGPVEGVNLGILAAKGSLFVTRPTLKDYIATRDELEAAAEVLFTRIAKGDVQLDIGQRYALKDAAEAHRALAARRTTGASILVP